MNDFFASPISDIMVAKFLPQFERILWELQPPPLNPGMISGLPCGTDRSIVLLNEHALLQEI